MTEFLDVLTAGGTVVLDLTDAIANGYLDDRAAETSGDAIQAVIKSIDRGIALPDKNGNICLIDPQAPLAFTYRRT